MNPTTVRFDSDIHLAAVLDVLLRVRASDPTYPPARDANATAAEFSAWLLDGKHLARWVCTDDSRVLGFVQLTPAHDYLTNYLSTIAYESLADGYAEVGKLFADPEARGRGVGSQLLRTARTYAWQLSMQPVLAVVVTSTSARELYRRSGLRELGSFDGIHGENRVFVDEDGDGMRQQQVATPLCAPKS